MNARRIADFDWHRIGAELDARGNAVLPGLLTPGECASPATAYDDPALFRSWIVMARHGFGRGEYQYSLIPCPARDLRGRSITRFCGRGFSPDKHGANGCRG